MFLVLEESSWKLVADLLIFEQTLSRCLLKCYYDKILDIHFFTFLYRIGLSFISCQISIYYENLRLPLYFFCHKSCQVPDVLK